MLSIMNDHDGVKSIFRMLRANSEASSNTFRISKK
jgi:hypothetical protein